METVTTPMLLVSASSGVAHHPIFPIPPLSAQLVLRQVDAEEVSEAVVALALVEVFIEPGALEWWRHRRQLVQGELLALVRGAIHNLVLRAEGRGLAAGHQAGDHQHIQIVRVVIAWAGQEVIATDTAAV
ncbi:hypothetical protein D3C77_420830 [compost metagenome]